MMLPLDGTAIATLSIVGVMVGGGLFAQAKMLGRRSQQVDSLEAAIQGKDDQSGLVQECKQIVIGQTRLEQQVEDLHNSIHNGLEEKMEKVGSKVDQIGTEFAELRGSVTMFMDMQRSKGGKHASN